METATLKTLAEAVLARNRQGNQSETCGFPGPENRGQSFLESFPASERDFQASVAAIREREGVPAEWCDGVARLPTMTPPADWPPRHWPVLVSDAREFLATWGAEAHGLDWLALDLFGVHEQRPFARLDMMGLIPLLGGHRIAELHADRAVIEVRPAIQQTFRRWPRLASPNERLLIWELDNARHED